MNRLKCLSPIRQPHSFKDLTIEGTVPRDLNGALYRVGPGTFEAFDTPYPHWFDGEGAIVSARFGEGQVQGACHTLDLIPESEKKLGRVSLGRFGIAPDSLWKRIQSTWTSKVYLNSANTALMHWQNRLFSLYEGDAPTEVSLEDLTLVGETDLGIVKRAFTAHPKYVPSRKTTYAYGFRILPRPSLDLYSLPDEGEPKRFGSVAFNGASFVHDFAATPHFLIFFVCPVFANPAKLVIQGQSIADAIDWKPEKGTQVIVVPIDQPSKPIVFQTKPFFFVHTANAFETSEGKIVVDGINGDDAMPSMDWVASVSKNANSLPKNNKGFLERLEVDLKTKSVSRKKLCDLVCEFPQINTQFLNQPDYQKAYVATFKDQANPYEDLYDCAAMIDLKTNQATMIDYGTNQAVSEPIFVAKQGSESEDEGYLITQNYDVAKDLSYVAIVDLQKMNEGPIAKAWFDQPLPYNFHGLWV